jgi:hypothetical protein
VRETDGRGRDRHVWRQAAGATSDRPILFGDGRSVAAVWSWGATAVIPSGWSDWRGQSLPPENRSPELYRGGAPSRSLRHDVQGTFGPRFRYVEQIIEGDAPIFALGAVSRVDPALSAADADDEARGEGDDRGEQGDEGKHADDAGGGGGSWRPEPDRLGIVPTPDAVIDADWRARPGSSDRRRGSPS